MDVLEFIKFAKTINKSKKIKRTGFVREGVKNPESIADHCFLVVVMTLVLGPYLGVDQEKLLKMAVIHDLAEAKVGDLVAERGKIRDENFKAEKERKEEKAIKEMLGTFSDEYLKLFHEMHEKKTREAQIFKQLDRLEMAMQSTEYEKEQNLDLTEFYENAQMHITDPLLKDILEHLRENNSV